jgi:hypothetical protein
MPRFLLFSRVPRRLFLPSAPWAPPLRGSATLGHSRFPASDSQFLPCSHTPGTSRVHLALRLAMAGEHEESHGLCGELQGEWPDSMGFLEAKSVGYEFLELVDEAVPMYRLALAEPDAHSNLTDLGWIGVPLARPESPPGVFSALPSIRGVELCERDRPSFGSRLARSSPDKSSPCAPPISLRPSSF